MTEDFQQDLHVHIQKIKDFHLLFHILFVILLRPEIFQTFLRWYMNKLITGKQNKRFQKLTAFSVFVWKEKLGSRGSNVEAPFGSDENGWDQE